MTNFFSINLARLMEERGLTQEALAERAKVGYHTVFRAVSKGVIPRGLNQAKLAEALGVSVADLNADPYQRPPDDYELIHRFVANPKDLPRSLLRLFLEKFEQAPIGLRASVLAYLFQDFEILRPYQQGAAPLSKVPKLKTP